MRSARELRFAVRMKRGAFPVALVALSVGACSANDPFARNDSFTANEDDIIGGRRDTEHEAVVYLGSETKAWCSGTLIAPDLVLTAAHCLDSPVTRVYSGTGNPRVMGTAFDTGNRRAHVVAATRR